MAEFKNYDPGQISVSFKGINVQGFMEGTFVSVERNENSFEAAVGSQGDTTRIRKRNRSGQATITLQAESPTNDLLSAVLADDERTGLGVGTLLIKNHLGTTLCQAANAYLMKPANVEYGSDASGREWVIECAELSMLVGGSLL